MLIWGTHPMSTKQVFKASIGQVVAFKNQQNSRRETSTIYPIVHYFKTQKVSFMSFYPSTCTATFQAEKRRLWTPLTCRKWDMCNRCNPADLPWSPCKGWNATEWKSSHRNQEWRRQTVFIYKSFPVYLSPKKGQLWHMLKFRTQHGNMMKHHGKYVDHQYFQVNLHVLCLQVKVYTIDATKAVRFSHQQLVLPVTKQVVPHGTTIFTPSFINQENHGKGMKRYINML